jgi:cytosine/adenosine deaminase-related metal-dependent hydrolase
MDPARQDHGMHEGILALLRGGATALGDHFSVGANPEPLLRSPLRGKAFIEVLGVVPEVAADLARAAELLREQWASVPSRFDLIPSPHSVHALAPDVLSNLLADPSVPHSIHLAESDAEHRYFADQSGPLLDFIAERGSAFRRYAKSSFHALKRLGLLDSRVLAVHGNYLEAEELSLLGERGISLVHCPPSHAYFAHRPFPLEGARRAGVNIALGTDSLASGSTLSMLEVLRAVERSFPELRREEIFSMATEGGAVALRMQDQIGNLEAGKKADVIAVPWKGEASQSLFSAHKVCFAMIDGEIVTGF